MLEFSSIVPLFVLGLLVLTWPLGVLVARLIWESDTRSQHAAIAGEMEVLSSNLSARARHARIDADAAIAKARASRLEPILRSTSKAERAAHDTWSEAARAITAQFEAKRRVIVQQYEAARKQIGSRTADSVSRLAAEAEAIRAEAGLAGADWDAEAWRSWRPRESLDFGARVGTWSLKGSVVEPSSSSGQLRFALPALIPFSSGRCLLLEASGPQREQAAATLRSVLLRLLATTAPGRARFTFIDPVGLGQNVADFLALGDVDRDLITGKPWTEPRHISEQLTALTEHMETVIQKHLRNDFTSIFDSRESGDDAVEPYRFLVIFDFPVHFTDEAARRLLSIVRNGPRCGVFTLMLRDPSQPLPHGFAIDDLTVAAHRIVWEPSGEALWQDRLIGTAARLVPDSSPPPAALVKELVATVGKHAAESMNVEVPFDRLLGMAGLRPEMWWRESSAVGLKVPIGLSGGRRIQSLALGNELAPHGLIVGRTGSGKTNLMHVLISGLSLIYSPDELQLYLVDFKGGVGFKPYASASLPHAAVIAIESEREFGVGVLNSLEALLVDRFERFKQAGVDNLKDYRARVPAERMPRVLLIVDEYQEFFATEDAIAQRARTVLDRLARQGRSFGIHVLLATQSLSGTAHLPTSTMGQMGIRIALPCNESDARAILADDNVAARLLSRPGEAIYNSAGGAVEANSPCQVARVRDDDLRRNLDVVAGRAAGRLPSRPVIFEGHEPAALEQARPLVDLVARKRWTTRPLGRAWLGEPVALLPPVSCGFERKTGRHLLVVDRDEAQGLGVLHAAWVSLLCQHRPTEGRFYLVDFATADQDWAGRPATYRELFDHQIELLSRQALAVVLGDLVQSIQTFDASTEDAPPPVYLVVQGLQRARDLRWSPELFYSKPDGGMTLAEQFATILRDGPEANVHVLAWCDTVANARRTLDRHLSEFGVRAAGPMSADDSHSLLDVPDAVGLNRPHRLLLFDDERPGVIQKFRPYALPDLGWLRTVAMQQKHWEP